MLSRIGDNKERGRLNVRSTDPLKEAMAFGFQHLNGTFMIGFS